MYGNDIIMAAPPEPRLLVGMSNINSYITEILRGYIKSGVSSLSSFDNQHANSSGGKIGFELATDVKVVCNRQKAHTAVQALARLPAGGRLLLAS